MASGNVALNSTSESAGQMSAEDELMIKIISGGAILVILMICVGLIVRSVRQIMNPNAEQDVKPKEMQMGQVM